MSGILGFPLQGGSNPQRLRGISVERDTKPGATPGAQGRGSSCPHPMLSSPYPHEDGKPAWVFLPIFPFACQHPLTKTKQNKTANAGTPKGLKKRSGGCRGHLRSCCQGPAPPHPLGVHHEDPKEQHRAPMLPVSQHSPTGFILLAADAAAAEQREQEDEQQCQEGPCPDHPHPLVGLCKTGAGSAGSCPGVQPPAPTGTHPCGRRPSEGHTCRRGSCRLRHSWLRSGRAGR